MQPDSEFTNMRSLLGALARVMNIISSDVERHHERAAYLAFLVAEQMGLTRDDALLAVYSGLLHDIGAVLIEKPLSVQDIEHDALAVSRAGAHMLSDLPRFERISQVIAFCQCPWELVEKTFRGFDDEDHMRLMSIASVVHLADVASVMLNPDVPVLNQAQAVRKAVADSAGIEFAPEACKAFLEVTEAEFVWLDVLHNPEFVLLLTGEIQDVSLEDTVAYTRLVSRIIDFRSSFTAMHSAGVSASAKALAQLAGMTFDECLMMEIAGNLHDIGKLKTPRAILEKPGKLTEEEFNVIKEHPYYTRLMLMDVKGFNHIANWAGYHHEKLNGSGYPFHLGACDLDLGSRIVAVADVFSAVTEERPYRAGMDREHAMDVLNSNVKAGGIDGDVVALLAEHYSDVDAIRDETSRSEGARYFASIS